jgi:adenylate kinase family enzyme
VYQEQTAPVEQHYRERGLLYEVDGEQSPDLLAQSLIYEVERRVPA